MPRSALPGGTPSAPPLLRADARRNERAILQAAAQLLAEDPSASMQAIADVAGLSRPTVYRRFPNREELVEAIRREALAEILELLEAAAASSSTAADALRKLICELAGVTARYPLLLQLLRKEQPRDPGRQKLAPPELAQAFEALIARGRRDGTLREGLRADILTQVAIGGLAVALKRAGESGRGPDQVGRDVAALVLDGARALD
jgi:TetR/AcrR family transcriptional repressor of mexCD-oprJ operon